MKPVIGFLLLTLFITMVFGEKIATSFLVLVLLSVVLLNSEKVINFINGRL